MTKYDNFKSQPIDTFVSESIFNNNYESDISQLVCCDLLSPSLIAKSKVLKKLFKFKYGKEVLADGKGIMRTIQTFSEKVKNIIIKRIKKSGETPSVTTDEWTSFNGKRFGNINIYIDNTKYSLGLFRISESATGINLANLVRSKLKEFKLEAPYFITTDGASTMGVMCRQLGCEQQQCFLHAISLGSVF